MRRPRALALATLAGLAALAACAPPPGPAEGARGGSAGGVPDGRAEGAAPAPAPDHLGVETRLLDGDLVSFRVALRGGSAEAVEAYARCAAAQYALIRGYGFARHVRTNVARAGGLWRGDAVYVISASLPRGVRTIDAEVTVADCVEQGIPTV